MIKKRSISGGMLAFLSVLVFLKITQAEVDSSLVGYWKFDEDEGEVAIDSAPYENDGEIKGATRVEGVIGSGLKFDGIDDYVTVPISSSLVLTKAVTIFFFREK